MSKFIRQAEARLRRAWEIGTIPFAMLYRNESGEVRSKEWRQFARKFSRPAIIKSINNKGSNNATGDGEGYY
jgi:hypothetical protein